VHAVVPRPVHLEPLAEEPYRVDDRTAVDVDGHPELVQVGVLAAELLGRVSGKPIPVRQLGRDEPGVVQLVVDPELAPEEYRVAVHSARIFVEAGDVAGLVHAIVTLRQLLTDDGEIPAVQIADRPRFGWRGLSIDVARHFVPLPDLKAIVGLMALYKLNVLHLHLTDDQGWRLALRSRPELVRRSSATAVGGDTGGFYGPEDFADITTFAAARGIRVVPEIDVPGHVNAATHAYGELNPDGKPTDEYTGIEVGFSRLHADLPATEPFLRDVFTEVAGMTTADHVHIGGDEVLTMEPDEYAALVAIAADAVRRAGKQVVGWQEIAHTPLEPGTVVQFWDGRADPAAFVVAAQRGARFLMSPGSHAYLDMKYDASTELGLEWAGHIELRDAYEWEPTTLVEGLPADAVIGVEAAIWTETLRDLPALTSMLLPRLAAVAEVAWTAPEDRSFDDFRARVASHAHLWDGLGLAWYPSPQVSWQR
jgi:hexosaminidase